ncbi:MAG: ABC transporter ATP-binding protein [Actinobacteria bacterium]|nr:ABC transporter ATP-binding protein [Actinomycetota bacterium]
MLEYRHMADVVLETHNLTKEFIKRKGISSPSNPFEKIVFSAVKGIDLTVRRGEIFGLLGPNGAGKTTLTKMLCTLVLPSAGKATICGFDLAKQQGKVKGKIALISSEERSFYWRLTGRQNLEFFAALHGLSKKVATERIEEVLEIVEMKDAAHRRFQEYSTGMKQRMGLARGLLADPEIFFMDEPTKGLDPIATWQLHEFIRSSLAASGKTVVVATHHLAEAEQICDRVGIMFGGEMLANGPVKELTGDATLSDFFRDLVEQTMVEGTET